MDPSSKHVIAFLACVPLGVALACFVEPEAPQVAAAGGAQAADATSGPSDLQADGAPDARTAWTPRRVATGAEARGAGSEARRVTQPGPWDGNPPSAFRPDLALPAEPARAATLAARAARRAYDGAPPVMPHSAEFGAGAKTCLDCHRDGMVIGARVAHPLSHAPFAACTQCHIESAPLDLPRATPGVQVANTFVGLAPGGVGGERASAGAPPMIPHRLALRTRCLSCHGEHGYAALRTPHPERSVCTQCHVRPAR